MTEDMGKPGGQGETTIDKSVKSDIQPSELHFGIGALMAILPKEYREDVMKQMNSPMDEKSSYGTHHFSPELVNLAKALVVYKKSVDAKQSSRTSKT